MADTIGSELVDQLATKADFAKLASTIDQNKISSDGQFRLLHWMVGFTLAFVVAIALALLFGDG